MPQLQTRTTKETLSSDHRLIGFCRAIPQRCLVSRNDAWLDPVNGVSTFTLSTINGAPVTELATLMFFVWQKHHDCGM
ncbi:hypothetical protein PGTUg99_024140 [Puccinia graminis f. sp. tritici]|uniref:Uncharacterized protein n=1 Tax=Puccinia graminis f. sp. tritici TaxID=56615 RepID=A0A5B0P663_PUCGR|nr:hypothetical protein PGTUg99_024140 [Puccinia graminis f. sp. tritici]